MPEPHHDYIMIDEARQDAVYLCSNQILTKFLDCHEYLVSLLYEYSDWEIMLRVPCRPVAHVRSQLCTILGNDS